VRQDWEPEDLVAVWTLVENHWALMSNQVDVDPAVFRGVGVLKGGRPMADPMSLGVAAAALVGRCGGEDR
jgi:hypothetical protein